MLRKGLFLVLLVSAAVIGCSNAPPALAPPKPPDVVVASAIVREVTDFAEFQGKTDANKIVNVPAMVSGELLDFKFKEGAEVKEGDLLFEILPDLFQAEFDRTKANVEVARAHVDRLKRDYDRVTKSAPGSITDQEYNQVIGDYSEARGALTSAEKAHATARINLSYTKVKAQISGRISMRFVDRGNYVKAGETTLTRIVNLDPLYVRFDIDERTYLTIQHSMQKRDIRPSDQKEMPVSMELSNEHGFPHKGVIDFLDNAFDPNSGSIWMRGVFPNPGSVLTPDLFARVRLPIGEKERVTLIPEQALVTDQGKKFVWVVDAENHAEYRSVKVGAQHGRMRVIEKRTKKDDTEGSKEEEGTKEDDKEGSKEKEIKEGERVIVSGLQRVRSDPKKGYAEVNVIKEEPPPAKVE